MSKYDISRACGHVETVQIGGAVKDRDRKAEREAERLCQSCYKATLEAERAAASAAATEAAQAAGLPALTGTPRQVAWAEVIRAEQMPALRELADKLATPSPAADAEAVAIAQQIIAEVMACTTASEWIDARYRVVDSRWISALTRERLSA